MEVSDKSDMSESEEKLGRGARTRARVVSTTCSFPERLSGYHRLRRKGDPKRSNKMDSRLTMNEIFFQYLISLTVSLSLLCYNLIYVCFVVFIVINQ